MLSSGDSVMFASKLSEVVTLLFQANGEIRIATVKSKLMQCLTSLNSNRTIPNPDTVTIDGVAMFWAMYWSADGRVCDQVSGVGSYLAHQLTLSVQGVHLRIPYLYIIVSCPNDVTIKLTAMVETKMLPGHHGDGGSIENPRPIFFFNFIVIH